VAASNQRLLSNTRRSLTRAGPLPLSLDLGNQITHSRLAPWAFARLQRMQNLNRWSWPMVYTHQSQQDICRLILGIRLFPTGFLCELSSIPWRVWMYTVVLGVSESGMMALWGLGSYSLSCSLWPCLVAISSSSLSNLTVSHLRKTRYCSMQVRTVDKSPVECPRKFRRLAFEAYCLPNV